jgi:hypothetical protein
VVALIPRQTHLRRCSPVCEARSTSSRQHVATCMFEPCSAAARRRSCRKVARQVFLRAKQRGRPARMPRRAVVQLEPVSSPPIDPGWYRMSKLESRPAKSRWIVRCHGACALSRRQRGRQVSRRPV